MSRSKGIKKGKFGGRKLPPENKGGSSHLSWILIGLAIAVAVAGIYLIFARQGTASKETRRAARTSPERVDFQPLVGKWMRPDGGYVISVRSVTPDGRVDAAYFNPRPIHVSRAEASAEGNRVRLFIELQAAGYPGSTYELAYDPRSDVLTGVYFQAAMQQRFEVVFVRTE
jgi:hypothetical protein